MFKINAEAYILRKIGDAHYAVPLVEENGENKMIKLNETAVFVWRILEEGADAEKIAAELTKEYDVAADIALRDANAFIAALSGAGVLDEI